MKRTNVRGLVPALVFATALLGGFAVPLAAQDDGIEGDVAAGQQKAHTCLGCHGVEDYVNVYPTYHVPRIAGQHAGYIEAALKAYRDGTRAHLTMQANAGLLSDQDIADIAAWFSSLGQASP